VTAKKTDQEDLLVEGELVLEPVRPLGVWLGWERCETEPGVTAKKMDQEDLLVEGELVLEPVRPLGVWLRWERCTNDSTDLVYYSSQIVLFLWRLSDPI
jgi:hypothetical protein